MRQSYARAAPRLAMQVGRYAHTRQLRRIRAALRGQPPSRFVVDIRSMPGNPYDGHPLPEALEQVEILTGCKPTTAVVDKGFRGVKVEGVRVLRSGQKRSITRTLKAMIKRRSVIEPAIGHMKIEGRLARNLLKDSPGDAIHAVFCGTGHNLRLLVASMRLDTAAAAQRVTRAA